MTRISILGLHYNPEPSGNAPYTSSLAVGLARRGHDVGVLTGFPHYPEWKIADGYTGWSRQETLDGVSVKRLRHHVPPRPSALSRLHMEFSFGARLITSRWGRPEVVVMVSPALFSTSLAVLRARLSPRRPSVAIWVQDIYSRGLVETAGAKGFSAKFAARIEGWILSRADGVVVIHDRFRDYLVNTLGISAANVSVIRNWTHLPARPETGQTEFRAKMGWLPDDFVVLHAGNMGKKQGLENAIEAAAIAEHRGSSVRFVLMGDGNQRRRLEDLALGKTKISFIDSLPDDDFQLALTAADALLVNELPGVKDMSVPSKLTSYFNAGRPVIAATDESSVTAHEIDRSGGGIRVDAAAPSALVSSAEALRADENWARNLGSQGLRYRYETLSEEAAIGHYDEFITSLATSRSR
ncbi:glycosyltransferase [Pseudarthrobacter sp. NPDC058329]|uniref:glycosyltransferase n=1 Tax=Pseudarthrobacter sp. NPDC058329 TaxID=3346448 RepID=UPI0036D90EB2